MEGREESVFGPFILRRSSNLRTLWLHRHLDRVSTPIRGRLALTICRWGSLALVRAVHSRLAVVRE